MENSKFKSIVKLFDGKLSDTSGYVLEQAKVSQIVKEWEIQTTSTFTTWKVDKSFGETGEIL